jgi:hypothetical protein
MFSECMIRILKPVLLAVLMFAPAWAKAQTTQFTYQGSLSDGGAPANGIFDFQFKLFDTATVGAGTQLGAQLALPSVPVVTGIFTVQLDFGVCPACFNGADRFLEISVRPQGGSTFTTLDPRQPITSVPYGIRSLTATNADGLSATCVNCVTSSHIQTVAGSQITGTIPPASIPPGSVTSSAIADGSIVNADINASAAIAPSKIAGTAAVLGSNTFTATQSIGSGNLVLPNTTGSGSGVLVQGGFSLLHNFGGQLLAPNIFLGRYSGNFATTGTGANAAIGAKTLENNTDGTSNTAAGAYALNKNTSGSQNTASGLYALFNNLDGDYNTAAGVNTLFSNTSGWKNTAIGYLSMQSNTQGWENTAIGDRSLYANTLGYRNTALGANAGNTDIAANANTTGVQNTFVGYNAGPGTPTPLNNATAIGANAVVSASNALVLGSNSASVGIGTSSPGARLHVKGDGELIRLQGAFAGAPNTAYLTFRDGNGTRIGYVGDGSSNDSGIILASDSGDVGLLTTAGRVLNATTTGRVGIGTVAPASTLDVRSADTGTTEFSIRNSSSGSLQSLVFSTYGVSGAGAIWPGLGSAGRSSLLAPSQFVLRATGGLLFSGSGTAEHMRIETNGRVGIGTSNLDYTLNVVGTSQMQGDVYVVGLLGGYGDGFVTGTFQVGMPASGGTSSVCWAALYLAYCSSSLRYKSDIEPYRSGFALIDQLEPISFRWKADGRTDFGLGAEDVERIEPLLVTYDKDGHVEGVKYERIGVVLINVVKEQQRQIERQIERLEQLEGRIKAIQRELDNIRGERSNE